MALILKLRRPRSSSTPCSAHRCQAEVNRRGGQGLADGEGDREGVGQGSGQHRAAWSEQRKQAAEPVSTRSAPIVLNSAALRALAGRQNEPAGTA